MHPDPYDSEVAIVALSVAMTFTFTFIGLLACIIVTSADGKKNYNKVLEDNKSLIALIDERLSTENKLDMSLDEIVRLNKLRGRTERRSMRLRMA